LPLSRRLKIILPERMWILRKRRGLSQVEIANITGLSVSTISQIEGGQNPNPLLGSVDDIGRALCTTPDGLLGYNLLGFNGIQEPAITDGITPRCGQCGTLLLPGRTHIAGGGECILACHESGNTCETIAVRFGHTPDSVCFIIREEMELRRLRPAVPVFADSARSALVSRA
jgi:DNA-binding XRE family transcriptional regulator